MKAILFDLDDTLYDQAQPFVRAYEAVFGGRFDIDPTALFVCSRKYSDKVFEASARGEMAMDDMYVYRLTKAFEEFGIMIGREEALDFQGLYEYFQHHAELSQRIVDLLGDLQGRVALGVITNGPAMHQKAKADSLELERFMPANHIFISGAVGVGKPASEIFELALKTLDVDAGDAVFFGDSYESDMVGAMNAGMHTVWMNHRKRDLREGARIPEWTVQSAEEMAALARRLAGLDPDGID